VSFRGHRSFQATRNARHFSNRLSNSITRVCNAGRCRNVQAFRLSGSRKPQFADWGFFFVSAGRSACAYRLMTEWPTWKFLGGPERKTFGGIKDLDDAPYAPRPLTGARPSPACGAFYWRMRMKKIERMIVPALAVAGFAAVVAGSIMISPAQAANAGAPASGANSPSGNATTSTPQQTINPPPSPPGPTYNSSSPNTAPQSPESPVSPDTPGTTPGSLSH
jgi:hypothetical protein